MALDIKWDFQESHEYPFQAYMSGTVDVDGKIYRYGVRLGSPYWKYQEMGGRQIRMELERLIHGVSREA